MKLRTLFILAFLLFATDCFTQNDTNAVKAIHEKLRVFQKNEQIDSIWFYENKAYEISKKTNYENGIAHALSSFGVIYKIRGNYPKALENFFKALSIDEKNKNEYRILVEYSGIASVYYFQNDLQKAKSYYLKAIELSRKINAKEVESDNLCNLAILYGDLDQYTEAEECLLKALEIDKKMNNKMGMSHELTNLGELYITMSKYDQALNFAKQALNLANEIEYKEIIPNCYGIIGTAYSCLNKNKEAEINFVKALNLSAETDDLQEKMRTEEVISDFYAKIGKNDLALIHFKKHIQYRDSMYNEESTRKSVQAEMNYEFEKKQSALKFENDKIIYELEAENKLHKQLRIFLIVFIALVLILLFLAKRAYDNKKKMAEFMSSENNRKEVLLQEVHHRINNNLQIISSLLTLQANSASDEKLQEYLKQSQNRIQSLSALHELLYQNDSTLHINMNEYLDKVMDYHRDVLNGLPAEVNVEMNITEANFPTNVAVPIALIVNELVTNSIKYAFNDSEKGHIQISLAPVENKTNVWKLYVNDSGEGIPADKPVRKDSLGIRLITIMAKQLNAAVTKSNSPCATFELIFNVKA